MRCYSLSKPAYSTATTTIFSMSCLMMTCPTVLGKSLLDMTVPLGRLKCSSTSSLPYPRTRTPPLFASCLRSTVRESASTSCNPTLRVCYPPSLGPQKVWFTPHVVDLRRPGLSYVSLQSRWNHELE
ncbi:hypothetical protein BO82DRAFT_211099 [Aspergillus uvarum CBS 121591]|uniref:Uncharacterized protein n=1 Tax=Aspergillus uvarum CBS 121591 TaxID=1448315 RepID=A0A319CPC6_9EURO|nr:hypothetical protein BO82DRAFT_211099 [Aspergillus uvarum CBS 121591]PYH84817.1 hypothetical protein BO82DRAFT_211099 [Aspergillus uvarum CBS 121591]